MQIAEFDIQVERKPIKNIHLSVYPPDARVHVSVPDYMREDDISMFLYSKLAWIRNQAENVRQQDRQDEREFVSGESHYLFGNRYLLKVIPTSAGRTGISKKVKYIEMYARPNATIDIKRSLLNEYYRQELHQVLDGMIIKWSRRMGEDTVSFTWSILHMQQQWGSCQTEKRKIFYNLILARVPLRCIEYVVVHELCHLKVHPHNRDYIALLNHYMPDWQLRKKELDAFIALPIGY